VQAQGLFAWHGSNAMTNFPSLFFEGWDPARRNRQAHGEGEYFGTDHDNTLYYSTGTKRLIVAFVLRGPHLEYVGGHCYIVNNPNGDISHCLPVLDILVPPGTLPSHNIHPRRWNFSWETDDGRCCTSTHTAYNTHCASLCFAISVATAIITSVILL
jgi:hypothetical protein